MAKPGRPAQAAVEFERIALNPAETKDIQREANLQAAELYAKAGNTPKAVGMLERFVVTYPTPVADSIEARQKLADIAGTAGQLDKQRYWQREIVNADRTAGAGRTDRTQYLAAKSTLALASPTRDAFRDIALALPLKASLAKKTQGDGGRARRLQERRRLPRGRSHDAGDLRNRRDLPQARPGHHEVRAAEEARRRAARRIQLAARGAGLPVRRAGDLDARDQHQAHARGRLRRRREEEFRRARRAQARRATARPR